MSELAPETGRTQAGLFRQLVELSAHLIAVVADEKFTFLNLTGAQLLGASDPKELVGRPVLDFVQPPDRERLRTWMQSASGNARDLLEEEQRWLRLNGESLTLQVQFAICPEETPAVFRVVACDVGESRRAESRMRESEALYRTAVQTSPDAIVLCALDGRIQLCNHQTAQLYGAPSPEELLGRNILEFVHPDDLERARENLRQIIDFGSLRNVEYLLCKSDGTPCPCEISTSVVWDSAGQPQALLNAVHDVSERKRTEAQIIAQRDLALGLAAATNLEEALRLCLKTAMQVSGMDCGGVYLVEPLTNHLELVCAIDLSAEFVAQVKHEFPGTERWNLVMAGAPVYASCAKLGVLQQIPVARESLLSIVILPVLHRGEVIACFNIASRTLESPPEASRNALEAIIAQVGNAIAHLRAEEELRSLSRRLLAVQETERRRMARELHDEIGQSLTLLDLILGRCLEVPALPMAEQLAEAKATTNQLLLTVRNLALDLHPSLLDDLGLVHTLVWHFDHIAAMTQLQIDFQHDGVAERRFGTEVETAAYRIVQEALTNTVRYAGCSKIYVRVWCDAAFLQLQVEDRGCGFDPPTKLAEHRSSGLRGMHERAVLLGGQLTIDSAPGAGTRITAALPLPSVSSL